MPTALDIPEFAVRSFETRWGHVVQQQVSKLRDKVTIDEFQGKEKVYRDLSTLVWRERLNRLGDSLPQEIQGYKRKLTKRDFACQHISDRKDAEYIVAQLTTPGSEIEQAMRMSWNRKVDEMIAQGVSATVYGGAEPYVTPITLTGSRQVAVNYVKPGDTPANSGLTPWKLIELARNNVTIATKHFANVWAQMMKPFLADESQKLFGFHIVMSNRLTLDGATDVRTCVAWAREGMVVVPENMQIMVDRLPEKDHAIQVSAYADYGVMRRYEEKVGEVYCDESP